MKPHTTPERSTTYPRIPVGLATEVKLLELKPALTPEEWATLFGADEEDTVPAELAQ